MHTTDTHVMLRESLQRYLDEQYGFDARSRALAAAIHEPPQLWHGLATDLGILGASFAALARSVRPAPIESPDSSEDALVSAGDAASRG